MALYEISPTNMRGSGTFFMGRAGEALGRVALVYKASDGAWYLADADAVATMPVIGLTMEPVSAGQIVRILSDGFIGRSTWTWTPGGEIYASTVAGELTQVAPGGAGDIVQIVAMATAPTLLKFNSDMGNTGAACALLEGHTAYVGFDNCKGAAHTNYFLCDGTADDVQLNAARAYVDGLGGGSIYMERGNYDITAAITLTASIEYLWEGAGIGATVLTVANGANCNVFEYTGVVRVQWPMWRDFMIDGNKANNVAGSGFHMVAAANDIIDGRIENVYILNPTVSGILIATSWGWVVENTVIQGSGGTGLSMAGGPGMVSNCKVENCEGAEGIFFSSEDGVVMGCQIQSNEQTGLRLNNVVGAKITSNWFYGNGTSNPGTFDHILVGSVTDMCIIEDNTFDGNAAVTNYGINIAWAGAVRTLAMNNRYTGHNTAALRDIGTSTGIPSKFVFVSDADGLIGNHPTAVMLDTADTAIYSQLEIPLGFQELVTANVIVVALASGNIRRSVNTDFGLLCASEDYNANTDSIAAGQEALTLNDLECIDISAALTGIAGGDLVGVEFNRLATNVLDTINDTVHFLGIRMRYV